MQDIDLSRLEMLFGKDDIIKLKNAHFYIIGLGGVGSYTAEAIARFGIGKITIIDADIIERSNINRQLCALNSTIGKDKVEVVCNRIKDINPECEIIPIKKFIKPDDDFNIVFAGKPDVVIDAIDTFSSKIALLCYLVEKNITLVSCMGAGLRFDPCQIKIAPFFKTSGCPLAKKVRKELKKRGTPLNFSCVYSTEKPKEIINTDIAKNEFGKSPLGSSATIPAILGLFAANEAVRKFLL